MQEFMSRRSWDQKEWRTRLRHEPSFWHFDCCLTYGGDGTGLLMKYSAAAVSMRFEYVTPAQLALVTNEFTPKMVSPNRIGPPESPKQVPPFSCAGLAVSLRYSSLMTSLLWI